MSQWSRSEKLALYSLSVAFVAASAALLVVPEIRRLVGLDSHSAYSKSNLNSNYSQFNSLKEDKQQSQSNTQIPVVTKPTLRLEEALNRFESKLYGPIPANAEKTRQVKSSGGSVSNSNQKPITLAEASRALSVAVFKSKYQEFTRVHRREPTEDEVNRMIEEVAKK